MIAYRDLRLMLIVAPGCCEVARVLNARLPANAPAEPPRDAGAKRVGERSHEYGQPIRGVNLEGKKAMIESTQIEGDFRRILNSRRSVADMTKMFDRLAQRINEH